VRSAAVRPTAVPYHHLEVGVPDEAGGSVYDDLAAADVGVAMALGVGDRFARRRRSGIERLRPTLVPHFPAGEEQGLLGADWFVAHPWWPLARIAGVLTLDANAPAARPRARRMAGEEGGAHRARHGRGAVARWDVTLARAWAASDYYAVAGRGVPAVFYVPSGGA